MSGDSSMIQPTDPPREGKRIPTELEAGVTTTVSDALVSLAEVLKDRRSGMPQGEMSRHTAIVITELEKVEAYARRYGV